jgi:hypothetical protein
VNVRRIVGILTSTDIESLLYAWVPPGNDWPQRAIP